ncbi:hypothetical protein LCGC14_1426080 [marine sediment metagenome]|uniref:Uncharacterized protein n=1 Tax=marine sediment metagenome TaxID=412755 RepID=A0A0F9JPX9_9ZZZZ
MTSAFKYAILQIIKLGSLKMRLPKFPVKNKKQDDWAKKELKQRAKNRATEKSVKAIS